MTTKYETGATTHAVNDLILFTDNTRELAELKDSIYDAERFFKNMDKDQSTDFSPNKFVKLFHAARGRYYAEMPNYDNKHIKNMTKEEMNEYCQLYADDFENWKADHNS